MKESPITLHAQIAVALSEHQRHFGSPPAGFWLPECAFVPELEPVLAEHGVHWTLLETHGLLHATPAPQAAIFAPVLGPHGVAFFGRDPASARQVWSRQGGYPGDPRYREFHRDLAHEAEREYLGAWQTDDASDPTFTGLKYHAVTGDGDFKAVYRRDAALDAVRDHAAHFVRTRCEWAARAESESPLPDGRPVLCVAPYDAELFGHWWFEGPEFLGEIMRLTAEASSPLELVTPGQHLARYPRCERVQPAASSWGEHGHLSAWLDPRNVWMQSPQRVAEARLARLAAVRETVSERARAVRQAWRELLLMQASDWPFLLRHETAGDYPRRRFTEHHQAFQRLADMLEAVVPWDADFLREREQRHPLFPEPEGHERFVQESGTTA